MLVTLLQQLKLKMIKVHEVIVVADVGKYG